MHFLLTNDDGIDAPGIRALCAAVAAAGHRASVCAPDRERSAASHSVRLGQELCARSAAFPGAERAWAVDSTPADCARLGLFLVRDDPADIVIAGVNRGMNLGGACIYSGTVAAAMEASMVGTPGLAASLCTVRRDDTDDYAPAARLAVRVAEWMLAHPQPRGAILSLNVPTLPYDRIRGLAPAGLAPVFLEAPAYDVSESERGPLYRCRNGVGSLPIPPDSDLARVEAGYATLTKLTWDFRLSAADADLAEIGL